MREVAFRVIDALPPERSVEPHLRLRIEIATDASVVSGQLSAQVWIEPRLRQWTERERALLRPLFGPPELWSRSTNALLWTRAPVLVPAFERRGTIELALPSGPSLEHAIGKLLGAVEGGDLPLAIAFRGTLFGRDAAGRIDASPVGRATEVIHRLPVRTLRESLDVSLGDRRPISVDRQVYERLCRFRLERGAPSLDAALAQLLDAEGAQ